MILNPINVTSSHLPCGKLGCMQCAFNMMNACFTMMNASFVANANNLSETAVAETASPSLGKKETPKAKPKRNRSKANKSPVNVEPVIVKQETVESPDDLSQTPGPNLAWVPKKD